MHYERPRPPEALRGDSGRAPCVVDPNFKAFRLRDQCTANAAQPGCVAVQASCLGNPVNPTGCTALRGACTTNPNRPDCTGLKQLQDECTKDRTKPECSSVLGLSTPQVAPTLNGAQQQPGQNLAGPQSTTPGQQGTTPQQQGATPEQQGTTPENSGGQSGGSSSSGGSQEQKTTPKGSTSGSGQ